MVRVSHFTSSFNQPTGLASKCQHGFSSGGVIQQPMLCKMTQKDYLNSDFSEDAGTHAMYLFVVYICTG